jgi:Uma2 family endonuclease
MATIRESTTREELDYPTSDGRPMAETDLHRILMNYLIQVLDYYYRDQPKVYISGNLLVCYEPGNRRRHVSPDVFVVKEVEKKLRRNYLIWQEGKPPDVVIELTSQSTREEDVEDKFDLYQNTLRVPEYFLFDPMSEYLFPRLQGFQLRDGKYAPIEMVKGRLPSAILGLHLEAKGDELRLFDPATGQLLLAPGEMESQARSEVQQSREDVRQLQLQVQQLAEAQARMQAVLQQSTTGLEEAISLLRQSEERRRRAEEEIDRMRREMDQLRGQSPANG